jgi:anti-anti-sigma factor
VDPLPLDYVVTATPNALWIRVGGELDLSNVTALQAKLTATALDGYLAVELDLHRLTFCDCACGRLLLTLIEGAQDSGQRVTVHQAAPTVERLLSILAGDLPLTFQ